jgi:hypothetical protein
MHALGDDTDCWLRVINSKGGCSTERSCSQATNNNYFWSKKESNSIKQAGAIKPDGETALYDGLSLDLDQVNCLSRRHKYRQSNLTIT